jgi:hypothetical protein
MASGKCCEPARQSRSPGGATKQIRGCYAPLKESASYSVAPLPKRNGAIPTPMENSALYMYPSLSGEVKHEFRASASNTYSDAIAIGSIADVTVRGLLPSRLLEPLP